jgi:uncharacterized protein YjbJ (UPF0337 family)
MNERIDETKGSIKEGIGKLTGNTDMQAEGQADQDAAKASREIKGATNQVKGSAEETLGRITGDDESRARGIADQLKGDSQRAG